MKVWSDKWDHVTNLLRDRHIKAGVRTFCRFFSVILHACSDVDEKLVRLRWKPEVIFFLSNMLMKTLRKSVQSLVPNVTLKQLSS